MRFVLLPFLLFLLALAACGRHDSMSLYETQMGPRPWDIVHERQAEVAQLSADEQKLIVSLAALLQRKHDATGYPLPKQTFEEALRARYGAEFDRAVHTAAVSREP